jgi:GT2 family glycosyltransferase
MNEMTPIAPPAKGCDATLRVAIAIATSGRPEILSETLRFIGHQIELPDEIVICPTSASDIDIDSMSLLPYTAEVTRYACGSSVQRNVIVDNLNNIDIVVFFDDDFLPEPNYIANVRAIFRDNSDIVVSTGILIDDGINGPGIDPKIAQKKLLAVPPQAYQFGKEQEYYGAYGCNMAVRLATARQANVRFDETLPLYAWQEDIDYSRQMAPYGRVVRSSALTGIHLGSKRARTSGRRLGYSQIANPVYLMRKGTMSKSFGFTTLGKNVVANIAKSFLPESYVDRRGRCVGNFLAIRDLFLGRLHPTRILEMS